MERELPNFLHGTLEATIFHATTPTSSFPFNCMIPGDRAAFVTIEIAKATAAETSHSSDRVWNQSFRILCAHPVDTILKIALRTRLSLLGKIKITGRALLAGDYEHSCCPLFTKKGKQNDKLKLYFSLRFGPAECEPEWGRGLGHGKFHGIIDGVTFRQRSNCNVTLYRDAHHAGQLFGASVGQRAVRLYRPQKLWEDVFKAIDGAKHLIYIAGWSLNPKMVLVRDPETEIPHARGVALGELLKRKAAQGVAVRIILWDDETSLHALKNPGLMRTHDEDAFAFFHRTAVLCALCPRLRRHRLPTLFAHHQKTITVDAARSRDAHARRIISFVGGLDLCDGRYDTEQHSLFRNLNSDSHAHDFYQISLAGADLLRGGPREPWHDVHACVEGDAALDVLANFEHRWAMHCDPSLLVPADSLPKPAGNGRWNVQVFRSIDSLSSRILPDDASAERSIHDAYVLAIRRAERFIYVENQYFVGGCHLWSEDQHSGCKNLIPIEIALKVASKIRAGERFAVYIVIPMWPEGVPESEPVQDILHWTRLTVAMMYRIIRDAIQESGAAGAHPRDYLNFFCLANREEKSSGEFVPPCSPPHSTHYWRAQRSRRFMIYVHSKLMIVDDEYILIGSANVNQRSMDGERDTEIAIGCYQPEHTGRRRVDGDIQAYRMALWCEHTARIEEVFVEPESMDCVQKMRGIGEDAWEVFSRAAVVDMQGVHLVKYPMHVMEDGSIEDLEGSGGTFPDTNTLIKGRRSKILPPICTT